MNARAQQQAIGRALEHHHAGRLAQAEAIYRQVLQQDPQHADALNFLGLLTHQTGNSAAAVDLIRSAIGIAGSVPGYHNNLGLVYRALGRGDEAAASFRRAVALKSDFAEAFSNLGNVLLDQNQLDEAVASYRRALALNPGLAGVHSNLGNTLQRQNKPDEAIESYQRALALSPNNPDIYNNLGNLLDNQARIQEALTCYRQALTLNPNYPVTHFNLGNALVSQGKLDDAVSAFRQALTLKPDYAEAYTNLGNTLVYQGKPDEAVTCLRKALAIRPDPAASQSSLMLALIAQGRPDEYRSYLQQLLANESGAGSIESPDLFAMNYLASYTPVEVYNAHRRFAQRVETPLRPLWPAHANDRDPDRRLRVGYVSADFYRHSVARFMEPILAHHDRRQVELYGYYNHAIADTITDRIRGYMDHWMTCKGLSDQQLTEFILGDGIDILVDLAGHTRGNRLPVFARKPAPVQVTYLGYPATTGLTAMDYRLTTWDVDPAGNEAFHSERLVRLPHTLWCYRSPAETDGAPVGPTPALARGAVTFGSMNNFAKISPEALALWGEVLRAIPDSRLVMTSVPAGSARDLLLQRLAAHGVSAERVTLHGHLPAEQFRAVSRAMDLALDPFPYTGTTTTCEALWMGLPVITLIGQTSVARSGYALLKSVGLTELCARDAAEYVRIAVELAGDLSRLNALRQGMRQRIESSPLRDEVGLARDIEQAYRVMWRDWCSMENPAR